MSTSLKALAAALVLTLAASPAFALNPQPLPPGMIKLGKVAAFLPPGPCLTAHSVCKLRH